MTRQPDDLRRILADWAPVQAAAGRLTGRRVFVVGTGTSFHAANQGAYFLRLAGIDAPAGVGPNQWTAAEGALKIREAAHLFTEGLGVEQFLHGPGFALGPDDALVCLDGGGPGSERVADAARAIEARGTRVYRFAATELGE